MKPKKGTVARLRRLMAKAEALRAEMQGYVAAANDKFFGLSAGRQDGAYGRALQETRDVMVQALHAFDTLEAVSVRLADETLQAAPPTGAAATEAL